MSYSALISIHLNEKTEVIKEYRNSHGSAPYVWDQVAQKYLGLEPFQYVFHTEDLWPVYKRADMPDHVRHVLAMTYDNAIIMQKDFKQAAKDIRQFLEDFPVNPDHVNHWAEFANDIESADCPAMGFWMSSVGDNPFEGYWIEYDEDDYEEGEEVDPEIIEEGGYYTEPEWDKFWDCYEWTAEVKQAIEQGEFSELQ